MNNKELEILKDKYAMGTLTEAEHASLQVEMIQNPSLADELNVHTDLVKGVEYAGEIELKEMLEKIHYQRKESNPSSNQKQEGRSNKNILLVIIGLLLITSILGYFILGNATKEEVNPIRIYAEFYSPYQPSIQDRGVKLDQAINDFHSAYLDQKYTEAIQIIKPFLKSSKNNIKLTASIAAIETSDFVLAENLLNEIIDSKDFYFSDHALWYKALLKLKTNDPYAIEKILAPIIANPKADHHKEAKELIAKIRG